MTQFRFIKTLSQLIEPHSSAKLGACSLPLAATLLVSGCAQRAAPHAVRGAEPILRPVSKGASDTVNLALGKPFVCSDANHSGWNRGLTDGIWRGGIGTVFATGASTPFPKTVTVDLKMPRSIGYVAVGVPPFGSTKTVSLALSINATDFSEVGTHTFSLKKEERHLFAFPSTRARYVRLTYLNHYKEIVTYPSKYAFTSELAVYAPGTPPNLPVPLAPEAADVAAPKYGSGDKIQPAFLAMHNAFLKRAQTGPVGVLFLGDSITFLWRIRAKAIYDQFFGSYQPANFGIAGDKTQHILWRIKNGELEGIRPKVVVLLAGTNNLSSNSEQEIVKADTKIVAEIHRRLPTTKVLLLGIFPRSANATHPFRAKIKRVNAQLARLDDGQKTRYLDVGAQFLAPDGSITTQMMPDALHPSAIGYQIWADAMRTLLDEMMKQ